MLRRNSRYDLVGAYVVMALVLGMFLWLLVGAATTLRPITDQPPPTVLGTTWTAPTYEPEPAPDTMTPATAPGVVAVPYQP